MTLITNTHTPYDAVGVREDLSDAIYNISPKDTPFMSNIQKGSAANTFFEWQTDSLATAVSTNAQLDGDDVTFSAVTPTVRLGNYTQISRKAVIISGTLEAVDKAGRKSELALQLAKMSAELKRDMETGLLSNQGASAGALGSARYTGSLQAFLKTNCASTANSFVATTADTNAPTYTNIPTSGRTDGTAGVFVESWLQSAQLGAWTNGGNPTMLMVGGFNKRKFSAFTGIATQTFYTSAAAATAIVGTADVYVGDFGTLSVVANRFQRGRDAFLIDPDYAAVCYLRPFMTEPLAKTGDAEKRLVIVEYGLKIHNEAAHAAVYDLTTS